MAFDRIHRHNCLRLQTGDLQCVAQAQPVQCTRPIWCDLHTRADLGQGWGLLVDSDPRSLTGKRQSGGQTTDPPPNDSNVAPCVMIRLSRRDGPFRGARDALALRGSL